MNEIAGAGVCFIDPNDPAAIARAIELAVPRFSEMRNLGLENASRYSSTRMAEEYVAAYRRVLREYRGESNKAMPHAN